MVSTPVAEAVSALASLEVSALELVSELLSEEVLPQAARLRAMTDASRMEVSFFIFIPSCSLLV